MTDQFESMVDDQMPVPGKLKNYTAGNKQSRWASVLTGFFESVGIETRRDASTASNIDAVENLSKYPEKFLEILQRVVPQSFTFGDQPASESNDQFGGLLQEMLPIRDEDRADLKQMLGRSMPEHELEMVINNGGQLVQMIQQNFPELNIQMEGVRDMFGGARDMVKAVGRSWRGKYDKDKNPHGDRGENYDADMARGKQALRGTGKGISKLAKGLAKGLGTGVGNLGSALSQSGTFKDTHNTSGEGIKYFLPQPGMFDIGYKTDSSTSREGEPGDDQTETEQPDDRTETEQPQPERKLNFLDEWKAGTGPGAKTLQGLYRLLHNFGVTDNFDDYLKLLPPTMKDRDGNFKTTTVIPDTAIIKIRDKLKQEQLSENLIMKRTFNDIVQHAGEQLLEAPEDEMTADPAMDPAAAEAPPPAPVEEPMVDAVPDDMDKLQSDMLELVRRALIINPKDIDQESYMQLTTRVSFDNMQQVKPLLLKLVQNHYPDLDMGDVPKGPGT